MTLGDHFGVCGGYYDLVPPIVVIRSNSCGVLKGGFIN